MEVLYSTSGTSPADFTLIEAHSAVPATWTKYSYALPEGTLYFAIRYKSANLFALCVDDLTFTPCGFRGEGLETTGYNLYRDGELLTTLSAGQTQIHRSRRHRREQTHLPRNSSVWPPGVTPLERSHT